MKRLGLFESFIFERIRMLIFQNIKIIHAKANQSKNIIGICIFSKITIGTLPTIDIIGDEIRATLYNFFFMPQI
jgi:hypothetical protein